MCGNVSAGERVIGADGGGFHVAAAGETARPFWNNITIFIEPEDLLCGSGASKPFGLEMQYEYGVWTPDEVESLKSEIYTITPEDEAELYRLNERFAGNTANSNLVETMGKSLGQNERLWPFMKSGVILPPWKDRRGGSGGGFAMSGYGLGPGFALVCVDYSKILNQGANVMIAEAKEQLKNLRYEQPDILEKRDFWEGVVIVFEAWIRFAHRYADLCEQLAAEREGRKTCGRIDGDGANLPQGSCRTCGDASGKRCRASGSRS